MSASAIRRAAIITPAAKWSVRPRVGAFLVTGAVGAIKHEDSGVLTCIFRRCEDVKTFRRLERTPVPCID